MRYRFFTPQYDVVIVGAGPAGLSAARTAARLGLRTLILEKQERLDQLGQPNLAALAAVPDLISGRIRPNGLAYPELDLLISPFLVQGTFSGKRTLSPGGFEMQAGVPGAHPFPTAVVDRNALLRQLAGWVCLAGAELRLGTRVLGLWPEKGRVAGVRTAGANIRARIVISAEGNSRRLLAEAGLGQEPSPLLRRAFAASQEMIAPAAGFEDVGHTVTLGRQYTSAPQGFGEVIIPAPGRAVATFTVFTGEPKRYAGGSLWIYLNEYVDEDPRVCRLFEGARVVDRTGSRLFFRGPLNQVVANGFMAVGDTVAPWGYLGMLPAVYLGRQAAVVAAGAIRADDTTAGELAAYERLYYRPLLRHLEPENQRLLDWLGTADEELDCLGHEGGGHERARPWRTPAQQPHYAF